MLAPGGSAGQRTPEQGLERRRAAIAGAGPAPQDRVGEAR
jgi:hypothetical protein